MKTKLMNILGQFVKKAVYGLAAGVAALLVQLSQAPPPVQGDGIEASIQNYLWALLIVPALTGAAAAIWRWIKYDPTMAAQK